MGKFDGILICSDIDGTLTDTQGNISSENVEAAKYFIANGGSFTFCSGRPPMSLRNLAKRFQTVTPVIGLNGSAMYDFATESYIHHQPLGDDVVEPFTYVINKNPDIIGEITIQNLDGSVSYYRDRDTSFDNIYKALYEMKKYDIFFELDSESYTVALRKEMLELPQFKQFDFIRSWPVCLEMVDKNGNKGAGVKVLKQHLGNITKTVCIGDNDNDLSMVSYADIGYAVSNASPELKSIADKITVSQNESALAKVISEL